MDALEEALRQVAASSGPAPGPAERAAADWVLSISDEAECYAMLLSAFAGGPGRRCRERLRVLSGPPGVLGFSESVRTRRTDASFRNGCAGC